MSGIFFGRFEFDLVRLVVSTHLTNIRQIISFSPKNRGENKTYLKPPPSILVGGFKPFAYHLPYISQIGKSSPSSKTETLVVVIANHKSHVLSDQGIRFGIIEATPTAGHVADGLQTSKPSVQS